MFPFPVVQGTGRQQTTTWNPADKNANVTLSNGNLTATGTTAQAGARGTTSKLRASGGKWGLTFTVSAGGFFVGSADSAAPLGSPIVGSGGAHSLVRVSDAIYQGVTPIAGGLGTPSGGSIIDMLYDFTALKLWTRLDGGLWNNSGTADPATGAGGITFTSTGLGASLFPYGSDNVGGLTATLNGYAGGYPAGFRPWDAI